MCGADYNAVAVTGITVGSSPRVRSRRSTRPGRRCDRGIISACAEQTIGVDLNANIWTDHLRVCGADRFIGSNRYRMVGSSPRVRSRLDDVGIKLSTFGIISACAEQTGTPTAAPTPRWDHLRVCGADQTKVIAELLGSGSSPRVRSRPGQPLARDFPLGIISACAEQTESGSELSGYKRDHLRVCGADRQGVQYAGFDQGSSPRVRSRHNE